MDRTDNTNLLHNSFINNLDNTKNKHGIINKMCPPVDMLKKLPLRYRLGAIFFILEKFNRGGVKHKNSLKYTINAINES